MEVGELDASQLGEPYPGIAENGDDGPIAAAEEVGPEAVLFLAGLEHRHHLGVGVGLHLAEVWSGELQPPDAVLFDVVLLVGRPAEQPLDHHAVAESGPRGGPAGRGAGGVIQPPAVGVAADVVQELADVVAGDLLSRLRPAELAGVPPEVLEVGPVVALGVGREVGGCPQEDVDEFVQGDGFGFEFGNHDTFFARPPEKLSTTRLSTLKLSAFKIDIALILRSNRPFSVTHFYETAALPLSYAGFT
ncbi:hypothetical protein ES703_11956 [subsurface metagenome]